jgi:hypothetical protein
MEKASGGSFAPHHRKTAEDEDNDEDDGDASEEARCHAPFAAKNELF